MYTVITAWYVHSNYSLVHILNVCELESDVVMQVPTSAFRLTLPMREPLKHGSWAGRRTRQGHGSTAAWSSSSTASGSPSAKIHSWTTWGAAGQATLEVACKALCDAAGAGLLAGDSSATSAPTPSPRHCASCEGGEEDQADCNLEHVSVCGYAYADPQGDGCQVCAEGLSSGHTVAPRGAAPMVSIITMCTAPSRVIPAPCTQARCLRQAGN